MTETKRTILITGCSSGCGLDAAHTLRERGWRVFASCRKPEDCEKLISEGFESPQLDYAWRSRRGTHSPTWQRPRQGEGHASSVQEHATCSRQGG